MIDYAQIAAEAAELSRQFWEEIEQELVRQSMWQYSGPTPSTWESGSGVIAHSSAPEALPPRGQGQ
jgi:hypothetical protein